MKVKSFFILSLYLIIFFPLHAQVSVKDSAISTSMFYGTYSFEVPVGSLAERFGGNSSIGGGFMIKTKSNWLIAIEGNYLFGGKVYDGDSLLKHITTPDGFVIDANGYYADILFSERGYDLFGKFGKLIPLLSPNPNSGFTIMGGVGFLQNKIRIHNPGNVAPQVYGDYKKGYDRLNSGLALSGTIGYTYLSNSRLLNFYLGFEFLQAWTESRRDRDFDTGQQDNEKYSTQFYGIKLKWIIPLYKRTPKEFYLY